MVGEGRKEKERKCEGRGGGLFFFHSDKGEDTDSDVNKTF